MRVQERLQVIFEAGSAVEGKVVYFNAMNMTKEIKGMCLMDGVNFACIGSLEILHQRGKVVYASWEMRREDGTILGGVSREYFINKDNIEESDIIALILYNIANYRMGRKRIFSDVRIVE